MNRNFPGIGVISFAALLFCFGCHQRPKVLNDKGKDSTFRTGTIEVGMLGDEKLKDQIIEIIRSAPKPKEIAYFLKDAGASYVPNFTVPLLNAEKFLTIADQSLATGMYKFDLLYAKAYKRDDVVLQLLGIQEKMIRKIGLEGELASFKKYDARIKQNKENPDSLDIIISGILNELSLSYSAGEHSGVYALSYIGANIEGLYIISQVALMSNDNTTLIKFLKQQKERIKLNYMLLDMLSADASVAPYIEKMKPVMDFFNIDQDFTIRELPEVVYLIEQLRTEIIK